MNQRVTNPPIEWTKRSHLLAMPGAKSDGGKIVLQFAGGFLDRGRQIFIVIGQHEIEAGVDAGLRARRRPCPAVSPMMP